MTLFEAFVLFDIFPEIQGCLAGWDLVHTIEKVIKSRYLLFDCRFVSRFQHLEYVGELAEDTKSTCSSDSNGFSKLRHVPINVLNVY